MTPDQGANLLARMDPQPQSNAATGIAPNGAGSATETLVDESAAGSQRTMSADVGQQPTLLLSPGDHVDGHRVLELLGRGGMGEVYLAHDTALRRQVALKLIRSNRTHSPTAVTQLVDEARATARLNHPNIVTLYAIASHEGMPCLVLEHVDGPSLDRIVAEDVGGKRQRNAHLRWGVQIAAALEAAHNAGLAHGDLKPANVLLGRDGRLRVADFGLARVTVSSGPAGRVGTPGYMAPEQWRGEPATPASDVWALGVMLWEWHAGKRLRARKREPVTPAPLLDAEPRFAELVAACLAAAADERPDAGSVHDTLASLTTEQNHDQASPPAAPSGRSLAIGIAAIVVLAAAALGARQTASSPQSLRSWLARAFSASPAAANSSVLEGVPEVPPTAPSASEVPAAAPASAEAVLSSEPAAAATASVPAFSLAAARAVLEKRRTVARRSCTDRANGGELVFEVTFGGNGRVLRVRPLRTDMRRNRATGCVQTLLYGVRVAPFRGAPQSLVFQL